MTEVAIRRHPPSPPPIVSIEHAVSALLQQFNTHIMAVATANTETEQPTSAAWNKELGNFLALTHVPEIEKHIPRSLLRQMLVTYLQLHRYLDRR